VGVRGRSQGSLRNELSHRNALRTEVWAAELSYSAVPNIVYEESANGGHGNFIPASWRCILSRADWKARLAKVYSGSRFIPRAADRTRRELECANSSDALLMNVFCYPGVLRRSDLCALLAIEAGTDPVFGIRPCIPVSRGAADRCEMDLRLGTLYVEAKLTEGGFQTARVEQLSRYRDFETVFDVERLIVREGKLRSTQLIRGALAAHCHHASFAVFCDWRRQDLVESCFSVFSAVTNAELRCRLSVVTWQELAVTLPAKLQNFLEEKYGIEPA
jgi:hypothetical protein